LAFGVRFSEEKRCACRTPQKKRKIQNLKSKIAMPPPVVLSIAGSDNSAGAGVQADLKTISALGGYGVTAITCVVAEVPGKVSTIQAMTPALVAEQIRLLCEAFPIAAVKTGMLYSAEIIAAVMTALDECLAKSSIPPALVVDPVMVATSGEALLQKEAVALYREQLLPRATVITPNLDEVAALLGRAVTREEEMLAAGRELAAMFGTAVLVKGGHLRGDEAVDLLVERDRHSEYRAPFVPGVSTHGTGCTYSAAIATGLGHGLALPAAVDQAKRFVTTAIRHYLRWPCAERSTDALHHFAGRA
jgi:hydroxymethylpyrimidine/phosphomethylpyrimidine kinase